MRLPQAPDSLKAEWSLGFLQLLLLSVASVLYLALQTVTSVLSLETWTAVQLCFSPLLPTALSSGPNPAWCCLGSHCSHAGLKVEQIPLEPLSSGPSRNISAFKITSCSGAKVLGFFPYLFFAVLQWIELNLYNWKQNLACHHHCLLSVFQRMMTVNPFGDCSEHRILARLVIYRCSTRITLWR